MRLQMSPARLAVIACLCAMGGDVKAPQGNGVRSVLVAPIEQFTGLQMKLHGVGQMLTTLEKCNLIKVTRQNGNRTMHRVQLINYEPFLPEIQKALGDKFVETKALVPVKQKKEAVRLSPEQQELDALLEQISKRLILNKLHGVLNNL